MLNFVILMHPKCGTTDMPQYPTIEACIGNTPLVRLQRLPGSTSNQILAKLEGNNPAGSVKDRPALSMIAQAEARGEISPGDTLIEATSGNTGIALAMAAAIRGYRLILIMPSHMSDERKLAMSAYGAELLVNPGFEQPVLVGFHPDSFGYWRFDEAVSVPAQLRTAAFATPAAPSARNAVAVKTNSLRMTGTPFRRRTGPEPAR